MNKTKFSIMDASKVFKKSRTTIYDSLKNGELSRDNDGLIDLSELIRVYGNPVSVQTSTRTEHVQKDVQSNVEHLLKEQISLLKSQLDLANQREKSLMQHIDDLTHRIEFKGQFEANNFEKKTKGDQPKHDELTTQVQSENKRISVLDHMKLEAKKRGFFSRFFLSND